MVNLMERIMERYGTAMIWSHDGKEEALRGFFQPVTSRSWQKLLREVTPLGAVSTGRHIYIGSISRQVRPGDMLRLGDREYRISQTEILYDRAGPAYLWALCARKGGE